MQTKSGPHPAVVEAQQYVLNRAAQRQHARAVRRARNYVKRHYALGDDYPKKAESLEIADAIRQKRWDRAWALIAADKLERS